MLRVLIVLAFAFSADVASAERRVALVIGDDDYRTIRKLENAVDDARAVEDVLEQLGFEVTLEVDRDLRRMRRALDDFREDGQGADVALVFFAGHGIEIAGENRLLPVDADASSLEALRASTLPLEEVRATVAAIAEVGLIILDACRNDPFGTASGEGRGVISIAGSSGDVKPGLGRVGRAEGMLFAFSAAPGETASDGDKEHSPFTEALVKYLGTDGLEIRSTLTLVQQEVYDKSRGTQLPYIESGLPKLFFATTTRDELPERERLLLAMAEISPELRAQVERIGGAHDMPLAPLYGALIGTDAAGLSEATRTAKLTEAAEAFTKVRDRAQDAGIDRSRGSEAARQRRGAARVGRIRDGAPRTRQSGRDRQQLARQAQGQLCRAHFVGSCHALSSRAAWRQPTCATTAPFQTWKRRWPSIARPAMYCRRRMPIAGFSTLLELGSLHAKVGNIAAAERSFAMLRDFAEMRVADNPSDPGTRRDLAIAHRQLGNTRVARGNLAGALEAYREELRLLQEATAVSAKAQWMRELAIANDDVGDVLMTQGDLDAAVAAFEASLTVKLALVEADPDDDALRRDITIDLDKIGDVLVVMGKAGDAIIAYETSLTIRRDLAASYPDDAGTQRDLSISHDKIGDALRDRGQLDTALASYRAGRAIVERLAARDPQDTEFTRDIAVSSGKIGNILREQGDLDGALAAYRESQSMMTALAAGDPDNAYWQRDVSVNLEKVADVLHKQGDVDGALAGYQQSLAITEKLVAGDPTNAEWQRDLSITLAEIGTLRVKQRDYGGAAQAFADSLRIRETLAAAEPDNALWQRDLIIALADYAKVAENPKEVLTRALSIARDLKESGRLPEKYGYMIGSIEKMIDRLDTGK